VGKTPYEPHTGNTLQFRTTCYQCAVAVQKSTPDGQASPYRLDFAFVLNMCLCEEEHWPEVSSVKTAVLKDIRWNHCLHHPHRHWYKFAGKLHLLHPAIAETTYQPLGFWKQSPRVTY
jgi:hypothetical protein